MEGPRASDAERQHVVADLQRHYAEGRLSADEFDERVGRALGALTLHELYVVTEDLPVLPVVDRWTREEDAASRQSLRPPHWYWRSRRTRGADGGS
ncbi:MAG: DUF1707 SHOCT-like domain-containing protein [Acidimicrobiales bacterium]